MTRAFTILVLCCLTIKIFSQDYSTIIRDGDRALNRGDYVEALKKYDAAEALDPGKKGEVKIKRDNLFARIAKVARGNTNAQAQIRRLLDTIQYQKELVKSSLDLAYTNIEKSQKFINGLNLVNGNLAVASNIRSGMPYYGFINNKGEAVINYRYNHVSPFDYTGFAQVEKTMLEGGRWRGSIYLVDMTDNEFRLANSIAGLDSNTTALDLRSIEIEDFPNEIFSNKQLKILLFQSTKPDVAYVLPVPKEIGLMKNLECFSSLSFVIQELPAEIGQLENLKTLVIGYSNLKKLPPEITQLKNIHVLDLSGNSMGTFPPEIIQLTSLRTLNLASNGIDELLPEIDNLENLERVNLEWNKLQQLPPQIGNMKNLRALNLDKNLLSSLPVEIGQLINLQELIVSGNQFGSFPLQILPLTNLESLDLSSNKALKSIPPEISKLKNLRTLKLNNTSIPDSEQQKIRNYLPWCYIIFK